MVWYVELVGLGGLEFQSLKGILDLCFSVLCCHSFLNDL